MDEYNDTYKPESSVFDGTEWDLVEFDRSTK